MSYRNGATNGNNNNKPKRGAKCPETGCFCSFAHEQEGLNYLWLNGPNGFHKGKHGPLVHVAFEEPASDDIDWEGKAYTPHWWTRHCDAVDHTPRQLLQTHLDTFVRYDHPINIRYIYQDGYTVQSPTPSFMDRDDTQQFQDLTEMYMLEAQWFANNAR